MDTRCDTLGTAVNIAVEINSWYTESQFEYTTRCQNCAAHWWVTLSNCPPCDISQRCMPEDDRATAAKIRRKVNVQCSFGDTLANRRKRCRHKQTDKQTDARTLQYSTQLHDGGVKILCHVYVDPFTAPCLSFHFPSLSPFPFSPLLPLRNRLP